MVELALRVAAHCRTVAALVGWFLASVFHLIVLLLGGTEGWTLFWWSVAVFVVSYLVFSCARQGD